tara:strand:+ start:33065 stop:33205 length:141 start_codon:yes stop_codon:yes gene_type:complete
MLRAPLKKIQAQKKPLKSGFFHGFVLMNENDGHKKTAKKRPVSSEG